MRTTRYFLIVLAVLSLFAGCEYFHCGCDYEMNKIRRKYGRPERKSTIKSSAGFRAESWSYNPNYGTTRKYTFEWDRYDQCACEVIETTYYAKKPVVQVEERRWNSADGQGDCVLCPAR